jgi:hypothetical protein
LVLMLLCYTSIMRCLLFNSKTTNLDLYHAITFLSFIFKLHTGTTMLFLGKRDIYILGHIEGTKACI